MQKVPHSKLSMMFKNIPIGKYGKYVPYIQTLLDIIIIAVVFVSLLSCNDYTIVAEGGIMFGALYWLSVLLR